LFLIFFGYVGFRGKVNAVICEERGSLVVRSVYFDPVQVQCRHSSWIPSGFSLMKDGVNWASKRCV
jgi:hypothetical protein